jgi:hypothetical protein
MSISTRRPGFTFLLHDAGETLALRPVLQNLHQQGIPVTVITSGTAGQLLPQNSYTTFFDMDTPPPTSADQSDGSTSKGYPTTDAYIKSPSAQQALLRQAMAAECLVTGTVNPQQACWAQWFKNTGRQVIGLIDNVTTTRLPAPFNSALTELWVPTIGQQASIAAASPPTLVTGQPAFEQFTAEVKATDSAALRRSLGYQPSDNLMLWIGGYGPGYEQGLQDWLSVLQNCPQLKGLIALHPGQSGQLERRLISQLNLAEQVKCLPSGITLAQATSMTPCVATHQSTGGLQAWASGRTVLMFGPQSTSPPDIEGIKVCATSASAIEALKVFPRLQAERSTALLGIPDHAADRMTNRLLSKQK